VKVDEPGAQLLDERETATGGKVVNRYAIDGTERTLGIHPGYHRITVTGSLGSTAVWSFEAEPSAKERHEFQVATAKDTAIGSHSPQSSEPNAPTRRQGSDPGAQHQQARLPTSFYVGIATTTVFVAATAVTGGLALAKQSAFDNAKADGDRAKASELKDSGQRYALFADIALSAAAVSAGLTALAYFTASSAPTEGVAARRSLSQPTLRKTGVSVVPIAGTHCGGISLSGAF
jgi:hypothetical protein